MQRKPLVHANGSGLQSKDPEGDITVIRCVGGAVGGMSVLVMTALAVWEAGVVSSTLNRVVWGRAAQVVSLGDPLTVRGPSGNTTRSRTENSY